jgi:CBS domain containing-hemolysin-like protein
MIFVAGFVLSAVLLLVSFVQLLALESMRLLTRDEESLEYFKAHLQDRLRAASDRDTLAYSLAKHTLLVGAGSSFAILTLAQDPGPLAALRCFVLAWVVMLLFSCVVPQLLYRRTNGQWIAPLVPFLKLVVWPFRGVTAVLAFFESLSEVSLSKTKPEKTPVPGDDIDALISAGEEEGIIEEADSKLIQSVVAFGDKRVREVMTPRPQVVWMDVARPLADLRKLVKNEQYSRVPIGEGDIDHIIGFIHVRDLYELDDEQRKTTTIRDLLRSIEGVPETKPVAELLREMQRDNCHIVYVVDEYGGLAGIATLEDLVEEVFGEIFDEHEPAHDLKPAQDGSITVSGSFDVDHLKEFFDYRPAAEPEAATVGGLVTEWLGAVPEPGTIVERDGLIVEVLSADGMRVEKVRIRAKSEETENRES